MNNQEPTVYVYEQPDGFTFFTKTPDGHEGGTWTPLYPKKEWVGLTDEEATKVYAEIQEKVDEHWNKGGITMMFPPTLYKAIEAKLKEKNNV